MLHRLIDYLFPRKRPDFYTPATRQHLVMKQRGPEQIMETSVYDPKDDVWYVLRHDRLRGAEEYSSHEVAAWTYLPIRRLANVAEKEKN